MDLQICSNHSCRGARSLVYVPEDVYRLTWARRLTTLVKPQQADKHRLRGRHHNSEFHLKCAALFTNWATCNKFNESKWAQRLCMRGVVRCITDLSGPGQGLLTPIAVRVHVRIMRTLQFLGVYGVYMRHGRMPNVRCTGVHRKFAIYAVFGIQKRT
jgi:hypothetical protein